MFSVMGLLAANGKVTSGSIKIDGKEISPLSFDSNKNMKLQWMIFVEMIWR